VNLNVKVANKFGKAKLRSYFATFGGSIGRKSRAYIVFLALNTIWRKTEFWTKVKKRKGMTILDAGCGKHSPIALIANQRKFKIIGIDIFKPYLEEAKEKGVYRSVILGDVRWLPFKDKCFDAAIALSVIEHLEREDGEKLLAELERVSSWLTLLSTPVGKCLQHAYNGNPHQEHKHIWSLGELRARGFKIRGAGLRGMSAGRVLASRFSPFLKAVHYILYCIGVLFGTLFSYFLPKIASDIVAWKEKSASND